MEPSQHYVPALRFRWLTPFYDAIVASTTREKRFKRRLLEQAAIQPGWEVLDLGCGTGTLTLWAKETQPAANIIGLDGDSRILEIARRKAHERGSEVEFREGFSNQLPFEDNSFDCVLSSLFFHHLLPDGKRATLAEVRRVLRPEASCILLTGAPPRDPCRAHSSAWFGISMAKPTPSITCWAVFLTIWPKRVLRRWRSAKAFSRSTES